MKNSNNLLRTKFMDIDLDNVSINGKRFPDWDEKNQEAFFDGLIGNNTISKTKSTGNSTNSSKNSSKNWTDKFNIGNPDKDKGHWITLDNGKHLFIKDDKSSRSKSTAYDNKPQTTQNKNTSTNTKVVQDKKANQSKNANAVSNTQKGAITGGASPVEKVQNMYKRNIKLKQEIVKNASDNTEEAISDIIILGEFIGGLQENGIKDSGIKVFKKANSRQKRLMLEIGIEKMNVFKQTYNIVKATCGPDTAGMLDLAHGEEKMKDKSYIKDTIKIKDWNDSLISTDKDYWKTKLDLQFKRDGYDIDKIPGYFFKSNSEPSKRLSQNDDLKNMLKNNKDKIMSGKEFSGEFPQYGNDFISKMEKENNFKNAFGKVDFKHPQIDREGNLHVIMCDTYDFNDEDNILIQAGRTQMKKGVLKPFFTIHEIIIPKNEVGEILK